MLYLYMQCLLGFGFRYTMLPKTFYNLKNFDRSLHEVVWSRSQWTSLTMTAIFVSTSN
jgi:hypothetical protein